MNGGILEPKAPFKRAVPTQRPKLTLDTVEKYLDWIMANLSVLEQGHAEKHLAAVELVVRMQGNKAQAKATQHTLVEDGVIAPPPVAS